MHRRPGYGKNLMISIDQKVTESSRKVASGRRSPKFGSEKNLDLADMNNLFSQAEGNSRNSTLRSSVKPRMGGMASPNKVHPATTKNSVTGGSARGFGAKRTPPANKSFVNKK
jgi:hypothetical protein